MTARNHLNTAKPTTLAADINNSATSGTLTDGTGYPTADFAVTFDPGTASEEKVLIGTRTGASITGMTRGAFGTSAFAHTTGAIVHHGPIAEDVQEPNAHINNTGLDHHTQYHTAARHASVSHTTAMIAAGAIGTTELADAAVTNIKLASAGWTGYTPTLTQSGSVSKTVSFAKYLQIGKTVFVRIRLVATGSGSAGNVVRVGLPLTAATAVSVPCGSGSIVDNSAGNRYEGSWEQATTSTVELVTDASGGSTWGLVPSISLGNGDAITAALIYELP